MGVSKHLAKEQVNAGWRTVAAAGGGFVLDCSRARQFIDININSEQEHLIPLNARLRN